jgi:alpha-beta hydrolase superfamily lysophospholipase
MSLSRAATTSGSPPRSRARKIILGFLCAGVLAFIVDWVAGGFLIAPNQCVLALPATAGYPFAPVTFPSASGATIKGWLVPAPDSKGVVILMHGVRSQRATLLNRVPFLHAAGYTVLMFDFQAHGESIGKHITFGYLESRDATAAVDFIHQKYPGEKTAVLGVSMGGAAILLAQPPLAVNAMIVESVYPTIEQAIEDRLIVRLGPLGKFAAPLLTWQLKPRLGIGVDDLCPIHHVAQITVPKFFLAGDADRDTTLKESQALFAAAAGPKQLWIVPGAIHEDLCHFAPDPYKQQVLAFLSANLK